MTKDETEITRIRHEDLSKSLQDMIDNLVSYEDADYINLRTRVAEISDNIDTTTTVYSGDVMPSVISMGRTVYFDANNVSVKITDENGEWIYLI